MIDPEHIQRINDTMLPQWHERQRARDIGRKSILWRRALVEERGGKCSKCGFTPKEPAQYCAMDFHHRDPASKSFTLNTTAMSRSWRLVLLEAAKCDLICANCHRALHFGIGSKASKATLSRKPKPRKSRKPIPYTSTSSEEAGIEEG